MGEEVLQRWPGPRHRTMLLVRIVAWGVSALVSLRYALGLYAWRVSEKLEKPRYESLLQLPVAARMLWSRNVASTTV